MVNDVMLTKKLDVIMQTSMTSKTMCAFFLKERIPEIINVKIMKGKKKPKTSLKKRLNV